MKCADVNLLGKSIPALDNSVETQKVNADKTIASNLGTCSLLQRRMKSHINTENKSLKKCGKVQIISK
jgi:hypothetical protein